MEVKISFYPKCPEDGNDLVPISGTVNKYGSDVIVVPLDHWKCVKCGKWV